MHLFFRSAEAPRVDAMDDLEEAERARLQDQQEKREYEERLKKRDEEHTKKVCPLIDVLFVCVCVCVCVCMQQ